ncbi:ROK family protein [Aeromonas eucrenophila]|uniref:ROK family protein n=1 Tax=Aeromonas eucrenophila TaxID=649 RepID=A0ABW0YIC3_9GAMM|nr:ROK family protein [Aeromonas eucrenophila]
MQGSDIFIGIDLGGTQLRVAAITGEGVILEQLRMLTDSARGYRAIVADMQRACRRLTQAHRVAGIGVIAPGPLDAVNGVIHAQPTLPDWDAVPLRAMLEAEFGLPVRLENDANGAALGEALLGAGRGHSSVFYITVSTGVGGGFIYKRQLISGAHNCAGEIANMIISEEGPHGDGLNRGALESLTSGTALGQQARAWGLADAAALLTQAEPRARFVANLSTGIANVIHTLNPDIIIMGGGVMNSQALFWDELQRQTDEKLYPYLRGKTRFVLAALDGNAGIVGAALLAQQRLEEETSPSRG